jgi:hypothetical protein
LSVIRSAPPSGRRCGRGFRPPEQNQHVENPGEVVLPGQRRAQRLGELAELDAGALRDLRTAASSRVMRPNRKRASAPCAARAAARALVGEQPAAFVVDRERARRTGRRALGELVEVVRARLELGHGADEQRAASGVEQPSSLARPGGEPRVVGLADVMAVEILELLEVEARRRLADMVEVEPLRSPARG